MQPTDAISIESSSDAKILAWRLVHCKSRQEECAEKNLVRQGSIYYRPQHSSEWIVGGRRKIIAKLLFLSYLSIQRAVDACLIPLRSSPGFNCLLVFGNMPLRIADSFIASLQQRTETSVLPTLEVGGRVGITECSFAEFEAVLIIDAEQLQELNGHRHWLRSRLSKVYGENFYLQSFQASDFRLYVGSVSDAYQNIPQHHVQYVCAY